MRKVHYGITKINYRLLRDDGIREWAVRAKCNSNYVNPIVTQDPRKITCKNCKGSRKNKYIHLRGSEHNKEYRLAVNNYDRVTCPVCLDLINIMNGNSNLPKARTKLVLEISTDDNELLDRIAALLKLHGKEVTIDELYPVLKESPIQVHTRYNYSTRRAEVEFLIDQKELTD